MSQCPSCAAPQSNGAAFCYACGSALTQAQPAAAVVPGAQFVPIPAADAALGAQSVPPPAVNGVPLTAAPAAGASPGTQFVPPPPVNGPQAGPQAGPQFGPPTTAPAGPGTGSAFGPDRSPLPWSELVAPAKQAAAVLGLALAAATVLAAIVVGLLAPSGHRGGPGDWVRTGVWLVGLALGGVTDLVSHGSAGTGLVSGAAAGSVSVRFLPLIVTVAVLTAVFVLARREERQRPAATTSVLAARAAAHGVTALVLVAAAAGLTRTSTAYGWPSASMDVPAGFDFSFGLNVWLSAFTAGVVVFVASAFGRLAAATALPAVQRVRARVAPFGPAARLLAVQFGLAAAGAVALLVIGYVVAGVKDPSLLSKLPAVLAGFVLLAANVVPAMVLGLCGVPFAVTASGHATGQLLSGVGLGRSTFAKNVGLFDGSNWLVLLLLVPLVASALAAMVHTLRRPAYEWRPTIDVGLLGRAAGLGAVAFLLLALIQEVSVSASVTGSSELTGSVGGSGSATAGPALLEAVLAGAFWAALAVVALRIGPTLALAAPKTARRLARGTHESWIPVLDGYQPAPQGVARPVWVKRAAAAAGVVVVLVGGYLLGVKVVSGTVFAPDRVASAYLEAIAKGDAKAALALRGSTPSNEPLLRDEVLRANGVARPADVKVVSSKVTGDSASVDMAFTVAGQHEKMTLSLEADKAHKKLGAFPNWKVSSGLGDIYSPPNAYGQLTIGGTPVRGGAELAAFPGRYPVRVGDQGGMLHADAPAVLVTDDRRAAQVSYSLSEKGRTAVTDAVNKRIDECLQMTTAQLPGCPFEAAYDMWDSYDASNVAYQMISRPQVQMDLGEDGQVDISSDDGEVGYAADVNSFGTVTRQTGQFSFHLAGSAAFTGSGVSVDLH